MTRKKILFITGTRADYGKIKTLIKSVENSEFLEAYIFVSGMHLIPKFGNTYREVLKDKYKNTYVAHGIMQTQDMSINLGNTVSHMAAYVKTVSPDMIVVHGDRIDALAGAMVGVLGNITVSHIEGGEVSGTVDNSIRHAISKFAHIHLVCNEDAKKRLLQMGEEEKRIFIIGSPDIDIMMGNSVPDLNRARLRYDIPFERYAIFVYHPVTTEYEKTGQYIRTVVDALLLSNKNYIVVYPNNDTGSEIILNEYTRLSQNRNFKIFSSLRFEFFLSLIKNADFFIGNSSAGIRETCLYGIPSIDIGSRQHNRYSTKTVVNVQHVNESVDEILHAVDLIDNFKIKSSHFGSGNSTELFMNLMLDDNFWQFDIQKGFIDLG